MMQPVERFASRNPLVEFWFRVQEFLRVRKRFAKSEGLEGREYEMLLLLKAHDEVGAVNVAYIAEKLFIHHHVAAGMVKRLTNKGVIAVQRSTKDRRSLSLRLTPAGESLLERIVARSVEGLAREGPHILSSLGRILGAQGRSSPLAR